MKNLYGYDILQIIKEVILTEKNITEACLSWFTSEEDFPFFIQYGGHDSDLYLHSHRDFNELVTVTGGRAVHMVNGEEYPIKKGDVFVVGSDTVHGYRNPENFRICNVMYRHGEMFSAMPDIGASAGYHALFVIEPRIAKTQGFRSRLSLKQEDYKSVKSLLDDMAREYGGVSECRKTMLTAQFTRLAVTLSRLYTFDCGRDGQDVVNIAKAVSYIENHFCESISVAELAEMSHYSERHFMRVFRKAYNASPLEYIIDMRINHACALLRGTDISVSETAEKCGFDDVNYFGRIFKKRMGVSPSRYRKSI
ncbi:MAG: AraC family transcriptional regulator [Prevotella sp.]|nr:AraC family transcriptional regulator [Prevotella sp.]